MSGLILRLKLLTDIKQQWESQLINDAQFTANTTLPSIPFDVNDDYVAQQLGQRVGEEVSRFRHETPVARNPSGFWERVEQGIEQRYKNSFERQALITEGRASAYSDVIRESLGSEAANQQTYLDLGYTDSVTETRAGWIGISEIPAPNIIRTGIQATKFLAENKWGFFGGNKVKEFTIDSTIEKYPKQFEQYSKLTNEQLLKAINSHTSQIMKHQLYLKDPISHVSNWETLSEQHQENLIYHWKQDISRHNAYLEIAQEILRGKQQELPKHGW